MRFEFTSFRIFLFIIIVLMTYIPDLYAQKVSINDDNITLTEGKPFFPLGLYIGNGPATKEAYQELEKISNSPFNTILNYEINSGSIEQIRNYLDAVNKSGLKVIYSIKDFYEGTKYYPKKLDKYKGEEEMTSGIIKGIIFYSYFDLKRDPIGFEHCWADIEKLGREIKSLIPTILSTEKAPKAS